MGGATFTLHISPSSPLKGIIHQELYLVVDSTIVDMGHSHALAGIKGLIELKSILVGGRVGQCYRHVIVVKLYKPRPSIEYAHSRYTEPIP